jgi:hypothetical protein
MTPRNALPHNVPPTARPIRTTPYACVALTERTAKRRFTIQRAQPNTYVKQHSRRYSAPSGLATRPRFEIGMPVSFQHPTKIKSGLPPFILEISRGTIINNNIARCYTPARCYTAPMLFPCHPRDARLTARRASSRWYSPYV